MPRRNIHHGFTLIELLVVIGIKKDVILENHLQTIKVFRNRIHNNRLHYK